MTKLFVFDMQEIINEIKAEFKTMEPEFKIEGDLKQFYPTKVMDLGVQKACYVRFMLPQRRLQNVSWYGWFSRNIE